MSLFNFSNLIKPENPSSPASEPAAAPKARISDPSFRDLVQKIVDDKLAAGKTTEPESQPETTQPVPPSEAITIPEEIKEDEVAIPENLPALPEDVNEPEFKPAFLPEKEIKSEIPLAENQTYGTFYLKTILTEFSDILAAGKDLEKMEADKQVVASQGEEIESKKSIGKEARQKVADSLANLLNSETDSPELLNNALNSYQEYLTAFEERYNKLTGEKRKANNELTVKINNKKEQIKKLINQEMGGTENFQKIKGVVTFCKEQRKRALEGIENVDEVMKNEVVERVNGFVEGDLHGAVMLAESGDLIGLMMRIYNAPQK